jgi:hypothetical protein
MMAMMPPRNTKIVLFSRTLSRLHLTKWPKIRVMMPLKRFQLDSKILPTHLSIKTCWRQCSIIIENFLDSRINSKCSSRRPSREGCLFLRCFLLRRKSSMRKPRRWLISTAGLFSRISQSAIKMMDTVIVSCNTNLKFFKTKKQIAISTRQ